MRWERDRKLGVTQLTLPEAEINLFRGRGNGDVEIQFIFEARVCFSGRVFLPFPKDI